jgi:hypothetical protein
MATALNTCRVRPLTSALVTSVLAVAAMRLFERGSEDGAVQIPLLSAEIQQHWTLQRGDLKTPCRPRRWFPPVSALDTRTVTGTGYVRETSDRVARACVGCVEMEQPLIFLWGYCCRDHAGLW